MFNWLKPKAQASRFVGVDMYDDGFAMAVVDTRASAGPEVTGVRWCDVQRGGDVGAVMRRAVRELDARGLPAVAMLPHSAYSLVQLEAPELVGEELREATRWRVRDLIDFPVEQAVIDVFALPESRRPGAPALVYAVVAKSLVIDNLVDALGDAGLEVQAVDIVEMAIRNLALHLDRPGRPRAYLHLQPGQTVIEIADGEHVYLSRRVQQEYDVDVDLEILSAQMESLALEVQRSLDYFESQYALGPADLLKVIVCNDRLFGAFGDVARTFLTVKTERFSFARMAIQPGVELSLLGRGVTAVGAAMRGLPWAA